MPSSIDPPLELQDTWRGSDRTSLDMTNTGRSRQTPAEEDYTEALEEEEQLLGGRKGASSSLPRGGWISILGFSVSFTSVLI